MVPMLQMAKEATKTQTIEERTEFKVEYDPCATIADKENEEFPDKSTNERKDNRK
jgi:hypothetical protein